MQPKPRLMEGHGAARLAFTSCEAARDWTRVLISDECATVLFPETRRLEPTGRVQVDVHRESFPHTPCPLLLRTRWIRTHPLHHGDPDRMLMAWILEEGIMPSGEEIFGLPTDRWVLVHNREPKDKPHRAKKKGVALGIAEMEQPAPSPDLDSIESAWALLKMNVAEQKSRTLESVHMAVEERWESLDLAFTALLPRRASAPCSRPSGPRQSNSRVTPRFSRPASCANYRCTLGSQRRTAQEDCRIQ